MFIVRLVHNDRFMGRFDTATKALERVLSLRRRGLMAYHEVDHAQSAA